MASNQFSKDELTIIEEMAKVAARNAAQQSEDNGDFAKYGAIWTRATALIKAADAPPRERKARKATAAAEDPKTSATTPAPDAPPAKKERK